MSALSFHIRRTWWALYDMFAQDVVVWWNPWPPRVRVVVHDPKRREQVTR